MVKALTCPNCSAPLPTPTGGAFVVCSYCGTTAELDQPAPRKREPEPPSPYPSARDRANFGSRFLARLMDGMAFVPALEAAAASELADFGDQHAMVYTVAHLVTDFERETGAKMHDDPMAVVRVVQAYYKLFDEVARNGEGEINLPFLAVSNVPAHLCRTLRADDLARMGSSPPHPAPEPAPPPAPVPVPEPKKKKKGWLW